MPEPEKRLEEALAQNGSPDPERSRQVQKSAVARFDASMRRVARILFIYLCLLTWLLVFAYCHFLQVNDTKSLILYGLLMAAFFGTIILMKLWYWVMTTKIDVLKELKQLRLEVPRGDVPLPEPDADKPRDPLHALWRPERLFWWSLMLAGVVAVFWVKSHDIAPEGEFPAAGTLTSQASVTLAPDGSASSVTDVSCQHEGLPVRRAPILDRPLDRCPRAGTGGYGDAGRRSHPVRRPTGRKGLPRHAVQLRPYGRDSIGRRAGR